MICDDRSRTIPGSYWQRSRKSHPSGRVATARGFCLLTFCFSARTKFTSSITEINVSIMCCLVLFYFVPTQHSGFIFPGRLLANIRSRGFPADVLLFDCFKKCKFRS